MIKIMPDWMEKIFKKRKQTTYCYCPDCQNELISQANSCIEDDGKVVTYRCGCGFTSRWLFDAPVPVLLKQAIEDK